MYKSGLMGIVAALICGGSLALGYYAGGTRAAVAVETTAAPMVITAEAGPIDKPAVEAIIRDYLLKNPEILNEVQTALQTKQESESKLARTTFIASSGDEIFNSKADAIIGNPKGDVTVVEFFDYNCGYCRRALADMDALVNTDKNVRFVLKELPILGPDSVKAHFVAQSFQMMMPEKYGDFHRALLNAGHADEDSAIALAVSMGADEAKLREGAKDPAIAKIFADNNNIAGGLNITGTPSYVIKDFVVPGAMGLDTLREKVANVRKCQSATC